MEKTDSYGVYCPNCRKIFSEPHICKPISSFSSWIKHLIGGEVLSEEEKLFNLEQELDIPMKDRFHNKLPKQAQEGLEKLGEKIGDSEWDEVFKEYSEHYSDVFGLQVWLKEHYFPPKLKEK